MADETISIVIEGRDGLTAPAKQASQALGGLGTAAVKTEGALAGLKRMIVPLGATMLAAFAVPQIISGITGTITAASDLSETVNKVDVVFGSAAASVKTFADTSAQSLGMSRNAALSAAGTFGNLFTTIGLGKDISAEFSTNLLQNAADLASFNNIDPTLVLEKLRAGLVGESEPARQLGIDLSDTAVKQEAMRQGIEKATADMSQAEKVQLRYALIQKQIGNSTGDFVRTSTGLANSQRILAAEFANIQAEIGERLLPVIQPLVSAFAQGLPAAFDSITSKVDGFIETISPLTNLLKENLTPILIGVAAAIGYVVIPALVSLTGAAITAGTSLIAALAPVLAPILAVAAAAALLYKAWDSNFLGMRDTVTNALPGIIDAIAQFLGPLLDQWSTIWISITEFTQRAWITIQESVQIGLAFVHDLWVRYGDGIMAVVNTLIGLVKEAIGFWFANLQDIFGIGLDVLQGDWAGAWQHVGDIVKRTWEFVVDVVSTEIKVVLSLVGGMVTGISDLLKGVPENTPVLGGIAAGIRGALGGLDIDAAKGKIDALAKSAKDLTLNLGTKKIYQPGGVESVQIGGGTKGVRDFLNGLLGLGPKTAALGDTIKKVEVAALGAAPALAGMGDAGAKAGAKAAASVAELVKAMIASTPAIIAAGQAVAYWKSQIDTVNLALSANKDQLDAAQSALAGLNAQLAEQQQKMSDLTSAPLTGTGLLGDQISAIERQLKRLKLAEMGLPSIDEIKKQYAGATKQVTESGTTYTQYGLSTDEAQAKLDELKQTALAGIMKQFPEMTAEMKDYLGTLPLTEEGLSKILETLQLTKDLKYEEQLEAIKKAAEGVKAEMNYEDVIAQVISTKTNIDNLTGSITAQQGVVNSLQVTADALNRTLAAYQLQLSDSELRQSTMNDALELAYGWFLEDREKILEMGGSAVEVADTMDVKTQALLAAVNQAATDTSTTSTATLAAMVNQYKLDMATAVTHVQGVDSAVRNIPTTWTTVHTTIHKDIYESADNGSGGTSQESGDSHIPQYATGGSFVVGGSGGTDSQLVRFLASPGERVTVTPQGQGIDLKGLARIIRRAAGVSQTINNYGTPLDAGLSYASLRARAGV